MAKNKSKISFVDFMSGTDKAPNLKLVLVNADTMEPVAEVGLDKGAFSTNGYGYKIDNANAKVALPSGDTLQASVNLSIIGSRDRSESEGYTAKNALQEWWDAQDHTGTPASDEAPAPATGTEGE